jgi:flagellar basal-body rod protein FlgC
MNLFGMLDQSGGAMQTERMRAEVVAANMANAETTRTPDGTPYRRQHVIFSTTPSSASGPPSFGQLFAKASAAPVGLLNPAAWQAQQPVAGDISGTTSVSPGVRIAAVIADTSPPLKRYDPGHPDADAEGYVSYPDINPMSEMVDLMGATRAYGLNASAVQAEKSMITTAIEIAK